MEQTSAHPIHLDRLALKGAEVVADTIQIEGNPTHPSVIRGSVTAKGGTHVSFESITPEHAVIHMHRPGVTPEKVAESGQGFYYGLPANMTAAEATKLSVGLTQRDSK